MPSVAPTNEGTFNLPISRESLRSTCNQLVEDIVTVAKKGFGFLATAFIYLMFCYYQPHLFMIGFFMGVFFQKETTERANKIHELWNQSIGKQLALITIGVLTLPITASVLSAWSGVQCSQWFMPNQQEASIDTQAEPETAVNP